MILQRRLLATLVSPITIVVIWATVTHAEETTKPTYTFECIPLKNHQSGSPFATVAVKTGGDVTSPLLLWKTQQFSESGYTPERRCYEVTNRLNHAVNQNDGNISNLWLTIGMINRRYTVLCYVNDTNSGCNRNNVLFTLNNKNKLDPSKVMASMVNFSVTGRGSAIQETAGLPYVNLGQLVEAASKTSQQNP